MEVANPSSVISGGPQLSKNTPQIRWFQVVSIMLSYVQVFIFLDQSGLNECFYAKKMGQNIMIGS